MITFPRRLLRLSNVSNDCVRYVHHHLERSNLRRFIGIQRSNPHRANRNTHANELKWRAERGRKWIHIRLPTDFDLKSNFSENLTPDEIRAALMRKGINPGKDIPARDWQEPQLTFHSFQGIVDSYIPPNEPAPIYHIKDKFSEAKERTFNMYRSYMNGTRRIKKKEGFGKFDVKQFAIQAQKIYTDAYEALAKRDVNALHGLITEHAYTKMWPDVEKGSLFFELDGFTESKVLTVRCGDYPYESGNDIAQITVKLRSKQKRAVYDRFGRLLLGSPTESKEYLEYVVFENHVSSLDGCWRLHDKIYPHWMNTKDGINRPTLLKNMDSSKRPSSPTPLELGAEDKLRKEEAELKKEKD